MNWRRGSLRLWIVTSASWILCIALVTTLRIWGDIRGNYEYAQTIRVENEVFIPVPPREAKNAPHFVLSTDVAERQPEQQFFQTFADGSSLYIHRTHPLPDKEFLAKAFWDQRWSRWWGIVGYWPPIIMVAPPIVVLLLGCAVFWAIAGFRPNRVPQKSSRVDPLP